MPAVDAVEIRTADGVTFSLPLAGPVSRLLALLVDTLINITAAASISVAVSGLALIARDAAGALMVLLYFILTTGYGIAFEWFWQGRTLGKRLLKLRVADAEGLRLAFSQVLIRNLLRAVDSLPAFYLLGGAVSILNPRMQRLGDLAAGTIVIATRPTTVGELPVGTRTRHNSLREYRTLAARLRQKVEPAQARIALDALRRRDRLEPAARLRLFAEIAAGLRELVEFPEEATLYLTDEQYVWNVVEILFERAGKRG
jgi:uncharacterized RDD family membrane protein YckC